MVAPKSTSFASQIFTAAWMSIALGFLIEIALIIAAATFGKASDVRPFIADLAGKVSWSVLVCVGISMGTVAARARGAAMGVLGVISAPAAFTLAKAAHKSAAAALDIAIAAATSGPTAGQMMLIRGAEYGLLGRAAGILSRKPWGRLPAYATLGLGMGAIAATLVLMVTVRTSAAPPPPLALVSKGINEVLFPLGCSIVLFAANTLGERTRLAVAT